MLCKLHVIEAVKSKQAKACIHEEPFGDDGHVHRRACGDGFTGVHARGSLSDHTL